MNECNGWTVTINLKALNSVFTENKSHDRDIELKYYRWRKSTIKLKEFETKYTIGKRGAKPSIGDMLNVLYQLRKLRLQLMINFKIIWHPYNPEKIYQTKSLKGVLYAAYFKMPLRISTKRASIYSRGFENEDWNSRIHGKHWYAGLHPS
jgi:hypothetical protein